MNVEPWLDLLTFNDVLRAWVDGRRTRSADLVVVSDRGGVHAEDRRSFAQAVEDAMRVAAGLRERGVRAGDVAFVALPSSQDFLDAWLGLLMVGALPCAVPGGDSTATPFSSHVRQAAASLRPRWLIAGSHLAALPGPVLEAARTLDLPALRAPVALPPQDWHRPLPDDVLHLQLTSGSTGAPKAAALTHRNVIANVALTARAGDADVERDLGVIWLPLFHDMGLVSLLSALYHNCGLVLQAPEDFIRNPLGWLRNVARYGGTTSAVPNFALAYCVRRYRADLMEGVDLGCLRALVVGAERVHPETLEAFAARFAPHGFHGDAFFPCYGTAELTLAITVPTGQGDDPLGRNIRRDRCQPAGADAPGSVVLGMGRPLASTSIAIRDADGNDLPEGEAGLIHVRSVCLMKEYFGDAELTARAIRDGYHATGDHGYLRDGELFVLGRAREIIILRGRNYFPHEFEECVTRHPAVEVGRVAAFGLADVALGSERLVLVIEPGWHEDPRRLRQELQALLRERFGFGAHQVVFVAKGSIPRTTSRKIQRVECARQFAAGAIGPAGAEAAPAHA